MQRFQRPDQMLGWSRQQRCAGRTVAFVPTMGALHAGHLSLVDLATAAAECTAVSIYVNPTQFGPLEDFEQYPRDLDRDLELLYATGTDAVFIPDTGDLYPEGCTTWVVEEVLSERLEGASRPGHFRGVVTVVSKLLQIVEPDFLVLGQKDAQQVAVLRRLIYDLKYPVQLIVAPIIREPDGIALSSRNAYLSGEERKQAASLYESLCIARAMVEEGEEDPAAVMEAMRQRIEIEPSARIDYIAAVHPDTFEPLDSLSGTSLLCLAVFVGDTRLIDNEIVSRKD